MKKIIIVGILLLIMLAALWINDYLSYKRQIGDTCFYLVRTMANKDGKELAGLFYTQDARLGYYGGFSPGFPKSILWNERYLISKNFDSEKSDILYYLVIDMDSINANGILDKNVHVFETESDYFIYLKQINLSESHMNKTDNHIVWWESLISK